MSNPQKAKGDRAEAALRDWLNANGYPTARRAKAGWDDDMGDIILERRTEQFVEVKNRAQLSVNSWLDQMEAKVKAHPEIFTDGVLIVKRPGQGDPGEWWAIRRVRDEFRL